VSQLRHYDGINHLHFLTSSTYRRARLLDSGQFKRRFVSALRDLRRKLNFKIVGYVLMPEPFHLLLWPSTGANPSQMLQKLEVRTALFILTSIIHESLFKDRQGTVKTVP